MSADRRLPWRWVHKIGDELLLRGLREAAEHMRGDMLDVGCGKKPYQTLLGMRVRRWIGIDFESTPSGRSRADVFANALRLPFRDACFDTVLCTEVLEHVPQPHVLLAEIHRVLRPGSALVLTAPQTFMQHEAPHDYFRYTRWGLEHLAHTSGLQVVYVKPRGGVFACLGQMVNCHIPHGLGVFLKGMLYAVISWVALTLDARLWVPEDTLGHILVARKPAEASDA